MAEASGRYSTSKNHTEWKYHPFKNEMMTLAHFLLEPYDLPALTDLNNPNWVERNAINFYK